jgi:hypothetical protein
MGFFDFLKGDSSKDITEPELSVISSGGLAQKTTSNPNTNRDMLIANLLEKEKLLNAATGAYNNEKNKQNEDFNKRREANDTISPDEYNLNNQKLAELNQPIETYQNQIRDILRENGVSPESNPEIYNMYIEGREVADQSYSQQREEALNNYLTNPDAFKTGPDFPSVSQMEQTKNRRRDTLFGDGEMISGQTSAGQARDILEGSQDPSVIADIAPQLEGAGKKEGQPTSPAPAPEQGNLGTADPTSEEIEKSQNLRDTIPNPTPSPPIQRTPGGYLGDEKPSENIQDITDQAHDTVTDPIIFRESEINHPDEHTVFKSALSGLSIAFVEYIKTLDPRVNLSLTALEKIGFQLPDTISGAVRNVVSQIGQISHMDTAGMRGSKNTRIKLRLQNDEHKMLKNAVFYPFIIIAIKFYTITKQINLDLNYLTGIVLSQILKNYLKLPTAHVDYSISLLQNFPDELGEAYLNNSNQVVGITQNQSLAIQKYIELIKNEYKNYFREDYMSAVKKTEYGSSTLPEVLNHLNNPKMLNVVYSAMMTIDNFILSVQNNDNVLLGLMGLVYAEASQSGDLVNANIISNSNVLGYVYFQGSMPMMGKKDIELEALKHMSKPRDERRLEGLKLIENNEKVTMWEDNNANAIVTIRGTDHKDNQDIIDNFLNFGGSREAYKTRRHEIARRLINEKEKQISNTGKGSITILGYSLGGATAMYLSLEYPHLKTKVYNPVVSNSEMQKELFKDLKGNNSNIEFFYVNEDPISANLKDYKDMFNMTMVKKNKFFTSHSLNNYN